MQLIRDILQRMLVAERQDLCQRYARQTVVDSFDLTFEDEQEMDEYIEKLAVDAQRELSRFISDGVYVIGSDGRPS